ncbi:MAG: NAD(P)H-hydrate epimerase [Candidatus Omnitrophota bacterium]
MPKVISASQMKKLDATVINRYGLPALILMENAGRSASEEALKMFPKNGRAAVFCGYGNNGGDGFVVVRHLLNKGIKVQVYLVGKNRELSQESKLNYQILCKMKQKIRLIKEANAFARLKKEIKRYDLIIDAIFGIGLKGRLNEFYQGLFNTINMSKIPVLALDVPSGLDADTGKPLGNAIIAKKTITFGLMKKGLVKKIANKYAGKIVVGDISLPLTVNIP